MGGGGGTSMYNLVGGGIFCHIIFNIGGKGCVSIKVGGGGLKVRIHWGGVIFL